MLKIQNKIILPVLLVSFACSGCDAYINFFKMMKNKQRRKEQQVLEQQTPALPPVENVDLAKMLLKPKRQRIYVNRDPFKPLFVGVKTEAKDEKKEELSIEAILNQLDFMGVVKMGDRFTALIRNEKGKNVYIAGDKINELTIVEIKEDHIILKKGDKNYTLNRSNQPKTK